MSLKITNIGQLATFNPETGKVEKSAGVEIECQDGLVTSIGSNLPSADKEIDASGSLVTPGFVDCHTHPVFAASRAEEFSQRTAGKTYQEIADAGGGIMSSVRSLRETDEVELVEAVKRRMERFLSLGTTTVEAKSGYGLSTESELKSLSVLSKAADEAAVDIIPTFLGAHDFPEEFSDNRGAYVDLICREMIPAVAEQGIAEFCDVFCEDGWFDVESSRRIMTTAREYGMKLRLHADEFKDSGAASLAAELKVLSADHLMHVSREAIARMAKAGVVATLLPGTTFFLAESEYAPARRLMDAGVEVAIATDFNPGSSMMQSMPFVMSLACLYMGMTVAEVFISATYCAAKSLGKEGVVGSLLPRKQADLVLWNLRTLEEIPYHIADNRVLAVVKKGKIVYETS